MAAPTADTDICKLAMDLIKQNANITSISSPTTVEETVCARWYDATREELLRSFYWSFARMRVKIILHEKAITGATQADPVVVTATAHGFSDGDEIRIRDVVGMTEINSNSYKVANKTANTFELNDFDDTTIDGSAFTAWSSGGKVIPFSFGYSDAYTLPTDFLKLHYIGDDAVNNYKFDYEIQDNQILINNGNSTTLEIGYIQNETDVTKFDSLFVTLFAAHLAINVAYRFTLKNTIIQRLTEIIEQKGKLARAINGQDRPPKRVQSSKFLNARLRIPTNDAGKFTVFDF